MGEEKLATQILDILAEEEENQHGYNGGGQDSKAGLVNSVECSGGSNKT